MRAKYSIVIPVYRNEQSINSLFEALEQVNTRLDNRVEVIFVDDGSPDTSVRQILTRMQESNLAVRLLHHSRNFGSFSAIRTGFHNVTGDFIGVISADLQEPPDLLVSFFKRLEDKSIDIVFGSRKSRNDPFFTRIFSNIYWSIYKKLIIKEVPRNGVDVFACKKHVVIAINQLKENNTSLVGMLFWIGFNKDFIEYERLERPYGKSAWTLRKKLRYMSDSVFAFSDIPIRVIRTLGVMGSLISVSLGTFLLIVSVSGKIEVPGYAPIMLAILFGNSAVLVGLGILGSYLWRTYENTQMRPYAISYSDEKK
jgi:polyisoprenyl-phosphate glycosyltransferase